MQLLNNKDTNKKYINHWTLEFLQNKVFHKISSTTSSFSGKADMDI